LDKNFERDDIYFQPQRYHASYSRNDRASEWRDRQRYVTLSATASDNVGVTKVEFYRGTVLLGSDTTSPYSITWNSAYSPNGSQILYARAYDAADNYGDSTSVVIYTQNTNVPPWRTGRRHYHPRIEYRTVRRFGSTDPNGTIVSYTWDNGLSGVNPTKVYLLRVHTM
jgi:hypothetical protein